MAKKDAALSSAVSVLVDVLLESGIGEYTAAHVGIAAACAAVNRDGDYTVAEVAPTLVAASLLRSGNHPDVVAAAADVVVALAAVLKKG